MTNEHRWWQKAPWGLILVAGAWAQQAAADDGAQLQLATQLERVPQLLEPTDSQRPSAPHAWTQQAERWLPGSDACGEASSVPWDHLSLDAALSHTLCRSPAMRSALAEVWSQSAGVELAKVNRRPRYSGNASYDASRNFNSSGNLGRTFVAQIGLSWTLFDFGQRSANLREARAQLAAALASQDQALLDAVRQLLEQYGQAVVAQVALEAAEQEQRTAEQTFAAAEARYRAQVGSQIDRLQSQTALEQARLAYAQAASAWQAARADLVLSLGGEVTQDIYLAEWQRWASAEAAEPDFAVLRQEALRQHPRMLALTHQIDGLNARLKSVRASNKGELTLGANAGTSRNWGSAGVGSIPMGSINLNYSLPLFNGREQRANQTQVVAQRSGTEAELEAAGREVSSALWQAVQGLKTSNQSLQASARLLDSAERAYLVAEGRYRAGVGSMLELLTAQASFADARKQRAEAQVGMLTARTQLSLAAGRIGH